MFRRTCVGELRRLETDEIQKQNQNKHKVIRNAMHFPDLDEAGPTE